MRRLCKLLVLLLVVLAVPTAAQNDDDETVFRALVDVESLNVRSAPTLEAEIIASAFEDDALDVIGRNLDGSWFEVQRPNRMTRLGWVSAGLLNFEFLPENLPLTDFIMGLEGDTPLTTDPGTAVYILQNSILRTQPLQSAERLLTIPFASVVPVIARNQTGEWIQVNYLGTVGWILTFNTRQRDDIMDLPQAPNLPPIETAPVVIIPPEVQLAEVERMRVFIGVNRELAVALESFWNVVLDGEVMPCEPPPFVTEYMFTIENERAFPELPRYVPRLNEGIGLLNSSIDTLYICGVVNPDLVLAARNEAINGRIIFDAQLDILDNIESIILRRR